MTDAIAVEVNAEPEVSSQAETVTENQDTPVESAVTEPPAVVEPAAESAVTVPDAIAEIVEKLEEPVTNTEQAGTNVAEYAAEVPMNSSWLSLKEIQALPSFQKLTKNSAMLLLEFWRTGSRLEALKSVFDVEGEAARLASLLFDKGTLAIALDDMMGISERDRFLKNLSKAVRNRKTTKHQIEALRLQAQVLGFVDNEESL